MTAMNLAYLLSKSAAAYPDHNAIVYRGKALTFQQLSYRVTQLASVLKANLNPGDRVAILSPNRPEILEVMFAVWKAGLVVVPLNFRLHENEVLYILNHSEVAAFFYDGVYQEQVAGMKGNLSARLFISFDQNYENFLSQGNKHEEIATVSGEDLAWLFYTSGTTGRPKGAMLTHRNLLLMVLSLCTDLYPFRQSDIGLHAAPLSHGSGLYALPLIAQGGTQVILESSNFMPERVFELIEKHKVSVLPFLAPTILKRLTDSDKKKQYRLDSLRCILYGGAPMYVEDLKAAIHSFGPIFAQVYGQGECPMTITGLSREQHQLGDSTVLSSAGTARTGVEIAIFNQQDGKLPAGKIGEVAVKGDLVMKGYWNDQSATEKAIKDDWLYTGDVGFIDDKGFLYILDRTKDMIISGGNNIYPREVEDVLLQHPQIEELNVFGIPDPEWGEAVCAAIVLKEGQIITEQEIKEYCKANLASYKKPSIIHFVNTLPKNAYGKIMKKELRARFSKNYSI
ncbi:Acyl-CoA synthetase (AMP-forming)/AMP-acid ligase II [Fictibacillus solisalsi]|uniref:Acyl-CoA synthetase (AMP-forming)/AMP-acid ligase II n=1 Tax=Fictibacillus solisalsi TaxID=459525 RepID=A0A1G9VLJ8_9BACL|nr:long-chain fatty acid--CoA ligase [Fictibacillus solisalsi]SDM73049.1 Acyl-CoA synthetase (AMP-forming)/AMP-acid ligase II [Fictibacillus solisalsi]